MEFLPTEVVVHLFSFLDFHSVLRTQLVCSNYREIILAHSDKMQKYVSTKTRQSWYKEVQKTTADISGNASVEITRHSPKFDGPIFFKKGTEIKGKKLGIWTASRELTEGRILFEEGVKKCAHWRILGYNVIKIPKSQRKPGSPEAFETTRGRKKVICDNGKQVLAFVVREGDQEKIFGHCCPKHQGEFLPDSLFCE